MLSQAISHAVLFEVDPKADYYVGWAGADISGAKLTEWLAAENNADANMREAYRGRVQRPRVRAKVLHGEER